MKTGKNTCSQVIFFKSCEAGWPRTALGPPAKMIRHNDVRITAAICVQFCPEQPVVRLQMIPHGDVQTTAAIRVQFCPGQPVVCLRMIRHDNVQITAAIRVKFYHLTKHGFQIPDPASRVKEWRRVLGRKEPLAHRGEPLLVQCASGHRAFALGHVLVHEVVEADRPEQRSADPRH